MIIKANKRGGGTQLANHLLNVQDNEHVTVHEISGFMSETVQGAMQEAYAVSKGTRCKKFLFSVSFNPPEQEVVNIEVFENAITRAEEKLGLEHQPRVIIFHVKEGRRHAHVAWSRIDGQEMKAIRQDYYKNRLMDLARDLYLENDWTMPQGLIDRELMNPLNFTHQEWMQAKRLGDDPRITKVALRNCWMLSDSRQGFESALSQNGFYLAHGSRRGFVAVDWRGEVYSLSRALRIKARALEERLGDPKRLLSVDETKSNIDQKLAQRMQHLLTEAKRQHHIRLAPLTERRQRIKVRHNEERQSLAKKQERIQQDDSLRRKARLNTGLRGVWDRLSGRYSRTKQRNEVETYNAHIRDRDERDRLILGQLQERQPLQILFKRICKQQQQEIQLLKEAVFSKLPEERLEQLRHNIAKAQSQDIPKGPEPEL